MSSPLIFCTSYFKDSAAWENRYRRWIDYYSKVFPGEALFLIDDGSPFTPSDDDVQLNTDVERLVLGRTASIFRFEHRLGRKPGLNYPGWFRSFVFSTEIAKRLGLKKIIHLESDAYILTRKALDYFTKTNTGWSVFWCPRYSFPETGLQIICSDQIPTLESVAAKTYSAFANRPVEKLLPYTHIEKNIFGNRYGEYRTRVPGYADFAVQINAKTRFRSELVNDESG